MHKIYSAIKGLKPYRFYFYGQSLVDPCFKGSESTDTDVDSYGDGEGSGFWEEGEGYGCGICVDNLGQYEFETYGDGDGNGKILFKEGSIEDAVS